VGGTAAGGAAVGGTAVGTAAAGRVVAGGAVVGGGAVGVVIADGAVMGGTVMVGAVMGVVEGGAVVGDAIVGGVVVSGMMLVTSPSSPATHSAITPAPPYCIPWCSSPRSYARRVRGALYATTKTVFELIDWQWRWASVKVASLKPILSVVRKAHLSAAFYDQCEE